MFSRERLVRGDRGTSESPPRITLLLGENSSYKLSPKYNQNAPRIGLQVIGTKKQSPRPLEIALPDEYKDDGSSVLGIIELGINKFITFL